MSVVHLGAFAWSMKVGGVVGSSIVLCGGTWFQSIFVLISNSSIREQLKNNHLSFRFLTYFVIRRVFTGKYVAARCNIWRFYQRKYWCSRLVSHRVWFVKFNVRSLALQQLQF
jgi:hypothetical protein